MRRDNWTRQETLIALYVYLKTPFGRLHSRTPDIIEVAKLLGRTPDSIAMKCCNIAACDPTHQQRGIKGLSGASRLTKELYAEFERAPETVAFDAAQAYGAIAKTEIPQDEEATWEPMEGLERSAIVKVRVNQRLFRTIILVGYGWQCAVCRLRISPLLVASHIVPWSIDPFHRMNPHNGLCLCVLHDKAFDIGYMVIDDDLRVRFTEKLHQYAEDEPVKQTLTCFEGRSILLPERWPPSHELLARHRKFHQGPLS